MKKILFISLFIVLSVYLFAQTTQDYQNLDTQTLSNIERHQQEYLRLEALLQTDTNNATYQRYMRNLENLETFITNQEKKIEEGVNNSIDSNTTRTELKILQGLNKRYIALEKSYASWLQRIQ